ncbi:MAG: hypothetical protein B6D55_02420 [Candidatus Omnitrophica bacterium 4484_70.2]|nr:MAG: hypothetical protein B6D55_02420 [Candidatus Omnitrophica bacterium 4484_70.2]
MTKVYKVKILRNNFKVLSLQQPKYRLPQGFRVYIKDDKHFTVEPRKSIPGLKNKFTTKITEVRKGDKRIRKEISNQVPIRKEISSQVPILENKFKNQPISDIEKLIAKYIPKETKPETKVQFNWKLLGTLGLVGIMAGTVGRGEEIAEAIRRKEK